jgi:chitinase
MVQHEYHLRIKREAESQSAEASLLEVKRSVTNANISVLPPVQQRFDTLQKAPPLPIFDITHNFIKRMAHMSIQPYMQQISGIFHSLLPLHISTLVSLSLPSRPTMTMTTSSKPRSISSPSTSSIAATSAGGGANVSRRNPDSLEVSLLPRDIFPRQSAPCGPANPCSDGSCCSKEGGCGFGPENCGDGCVSNCEFPTRLSSHSLGMSGWSKSETGLANASTRIGNATANCGRDSAGGDVVCPLDVCCSFFGYCGVSELYISQHQLFE